MWQFVAGLTFAIMLHILHLYFRATYKDDADKSVTEKLVKEIKGNNRSFSEGDMQAT